MEELGQKENEIIKNLDELRQEECNKVKLTFVSYCLSRSYSHSKIVEATAKPNLIS